MIGRTYFLIAALVVLETVVFFHVGAQNRKGTDGVPVSQDCMGQEDAGETHSAKEASYPAWMIVDASNAVQRSGRVAGESMVVLLPGGAMMEMVWCPAGEFIMGSPCMEHAKYRIDNEKWHRVQLSRGFWIGRYEVTQGQWRSVMGDDPSRRRGENHPVENVFWAKCYDFCRGVGDGFRLPTEAEWEYACRAGTMTEFSGSGNLDDMAQRGAGCHQEVGGRQPNAWGIYDMHCNVEEWCADWYGPYPSDGVAIDPAGAESGTSRVVRGGAYLGDEKSCRSASRDCCVPGNCSAWLGFRVVCMPNASVAAAPMLHKPEQPPPRISCAVPDDYVVASESIAEKLMRESGSRPRYPGLELETRQRFIRADEKDLTNDIPQVVLCEAVSVENENDYLVRIDAAFELHTKMVEAMKTTDALLDATGKKVPERDMVILRPCCSSYRDGVCLFSAFRIPFAGGCRWRLRAELWFRLEGRVLALFDISYWSTLEEARGSGWIESRQRLRAWQDWIEDNVRRLSQVEHAQTTSSAAVTQ